MKNALVTGGAGFLGSAIVRKLVDRGVSVRVMALPNEGMDNLEGLDVEVVRGNVLSVEDCKAAVKGMDTLFHAAAVYKDYVKNPTPMYQVNLRGTFNMLEAARRAKVARTIYTASVAALGRPRPGQLADETTPYEAWDINFHYSRSKHLSMLTALDFANWGLDVRVVCPAIVFGPGDIAPTPSGRLIINVANGGVPGWTEGGFCYVDVRDAAEVHVLAVERGKPGQMYVASGHNLDNKAFLQTVHRVCHGSTPRLPKVPRQVALAAAAAMQLAHVKLGKEPDMTPEYLSYGLKEGFFSNHKASSELGARFRPLGETVEDAVRYFRSRGLIG